MCTRILFVGSNRMSLPTDDAADRSSRAHLRSSAKREREEKEAKTAQKLDRKKLNDDFIESVRLLSPFICCEPKPDMQSRIQWAIEWSELQTLCNLPSQLSTIEKRGEIFGFLRDSKLKSATLCAYFDIAETSYFKYLKLYRDQKQSHHRVAQLAKQVRRSNLSCNSFIYATKQSRPVLDQSGTSQSHAVTAEIALENADPSAPADTSAAAHAAVQIEWRHSGRPAAFNETTLQAAKEEFAARVTGPKRGMTAEAMVEMLMRLRQLHQAEPHEVLPWPSQKTIMAAIDQLEIEGMKAYFTNPSRARALEDWRNAINCAAMWWAINDCGIDKSLQFGVDEVSILLEAGRKPRMMYLPKGVAKACRRRNLAPAAVEVDPKRRMAHMLCMTTAEGGLAATVVKIADHTVADGKIYLKFVETGLWVAFVNPKVPKPEYSKAILVNCLLPTIQQRQKNAAVYLNPSPTAADVYGHPNLKNPSGASAAAVAAAAASAASAAPAAHDSQPQPQLPHHSQSQSSQGVRLSQFDGGFFRPSVEHAMLPRAVLTFDGAHEQIEAVLSADLAEWCVEHNIGLFKWAAACSLVQQPNDVSRCHKILHRLFASSKYLYQPVKKENIRTSMFPVIAMLNSLPKLAKDSKLTFTKFFCNLPDILHEAFRPDVVRRGWSDAGIYPFNVDRIMSGWNHGSTQVNKSWSMLEPEYKGFCLAAIEKLREPARSGQLLDDLIEKVVVREAVAGGVTELTLLQAMELAEAGDPEYMKVHIEGLSQSCAMRGVQSFLLHVYR